MSEYAEGLATTRCCGSSIPRPSQPQRDLGATSGWAAKMPCGAKPEINHFEASRCHLRATTSAQWGVPSLKTRTFEQTRFGSFVSSKSFRHGHAMRHARWTQTKWLIQTTHLRKRDRRIVSRSCRRATLELQGLLGADRRIPSDLLKDWCAGWGLPVPAAHAFRSILLGR